MQPHHVQSFIVQTFTSRGSANYAASPCSFIVQTFDSRRSANYAASPCTEFHSANAGDTKLVKRPKMTFY